jgi:hypothetical protein
VKEMDDLTHRIEAAREESDKAFKNLVTLLVESSDKKKIKKASEYHREKVNCYNTLQAVRYSQGA